jgi:hypothetical protein
MNQSKPHSADQFFYQDRWVSKENFRAFVYNGESEKLANSYNEFNSLIQSGLWFASKDDVKPKDVVPIKRGRKPKDAGSVS